MSFWFGILSLLLSLYADVFEQANERVGAVVSLPFQQLISPKPVYISRLIPPTASATPAAVPPSPRKVFVLILDTSGSMDDQLVSSEEFLYYYRMAKLEQLPEELLAQCIPALANLPDLPSDITLDGFTIARAELCRYIYSLPQDSGAALWTFDDTVEPLVPALMPSDVPELSEKYILLHRTEEGGDQRRELIEPLKNLRPTRDGTNFEEVLTLMQRIYSQDIKAGKEVHFLLLSDFQHDITTRTAEGRTLVESLTESSTRAASARLGDLLGRLKSKNVFFHLTQIRGETREICGIVPIVDRTFDWYQYRVSDPVAAKLDFLSRYEPGLQSLVFAKEQAVAPLTVSIDAHPYLRLRLSLASEASSSHLSPFRIRVRWEDEGIEETADLRADGPPVEFSTGPIDSEIVLEPLNAISREEAKLYRLFVNLGSPGEYTDIVTPTYWFALDFQQKLSGLAALAILTAVGMCFISLLYAFYEATRAYRR